jgi:hypothetical protein
LVFNGTSSTRRLGGSTVTARASTAQVFFAADRIKGGRRDRCPGSRHRRCDTGRVTDTERQTDRRLERTILELLEQRDPASTICPSDAARAAYGGDDDGWRALMEPARRAARRLVTAGKVEITQAGRRVDPAKARGPIRIRRAR